MEENSAVELDQINSKDNSVESTDTEPQSNQQTLDPESVVNVDEVNKENCDQIATPSHVSDDNSDVTLITESVPTAEDKENKIEVNSDETNENNETNNVQKLDESASETTVEKCDDEPMDIDEILDSLNTDQEIACTSSEDVDDAKFVGENAEQPETTIASKEDILEAGGGVIGTLFTLNIYTFCMELMRLYLFQKNKN